VNRRETFEIRPTESRRFIIHSRSGARRRTFIAAGFAIVFTVGLFASLWCFDLSPDSRTTAIWFWIFAIVAALYRLFEAVHT